VLGCGNCTTQTHTECTPQNQCITVNGIAANECSAQIPCGMHTECRSNQCVLVAGAGSNACTAGLPCGLSALCGNGSLDPGEQCDNGAANANAPDRCRLTCLYAACGDGIQDNGEQCDDGNLTSGDGCDRTCIREGIVLGTPFCGDGILTPPETCDDGNIRAGDGCSPGCRTERPEGCTSDAQCGGGQCINGQCTDPRPCRTDAQCPAGAQCRDGTCQVLSDCRSNADCAPGLLCTNGQCTRLGCSADSDCTSGRCVHGSCVACTSDRECRSDQRCAGGQCMDRTIVATAVLCGNGILEPPEECDDSGTRDRDGCSSRCQLESGFCGDGIVQRALGELCEPVLHDRSLPYACNPATCRTLSRTCGNGTIEPGEECDEGLQNSNVPTTAPIRCRTDCSRARCGDRIVDRGEDCDDGNMLDGDGCPASCMRRVLADDTSPLTIRFPDGMPPPWAILAGQPFPYPQAPSLQPLPAIPLAQLQPLIGSQPPAGDTGPAAVAVIAAGAAAGWSFVRRRTRRSDASRP
jgi:cysteine-rich repeat protein/Cys-rich repeat protein